MPRPGRRRPDDLGRPGPGPRPNREHPKGRISPTSAPRLALRRSRGPTASPTRPTTPSSTSASPRSGGSSPRARPTPRRCGPRSRSASPTSTATAGRGRPSRAFTRLPERGRLTRPTTDEAQARPGRPGDDRHVPHRPGPSRDRGSSSRGDRRPTAATSAASSPTARNRPTPSGRSSTPSSKAGADCLNPREVRRRPRRLAGFRRPEPARLPASLRGPLPDESAIASRRRKWDEADRGLGALDREVPRLRARRHAQFAIASIFEVEKGDPAGAIERFRKVTEPALEIARPTSGSP